MMAFIQLDAGQSGCGATYRLTLGLSVPLAGVYGGLTAPTDLRQKATGNLRWPSPFSRTDHLTNLGLRGARERIAHLLLEIYVRLRRRLPAQHG
jgi:hypothetical protein